MGLSQIILFEKKVRDRASVPGGEKRVTRTGQPYRKKEDWDSS